MTMAAGDGIVEQALNAAREEFRVRPGFPQEVLDAADEAATRVATPGDGHEDRRDLPLVTIDPPGSRDLDQAVGIRAEPEGGFRLWYAIADVAFFVDRGGPIEAEAWRRGVTFYAPDHKVSLYPPSISENAGSLLPDVDRPCILFDFALDERAEVRSLAVTRAVVRSRAQLTYAQVVEHVCEGGTEFRDREWAGTLDELRRFGELREKIEAERGGVSLPLVSQHVTQMAARHLGYGLEFEQPMSSEEWNEQVSLLVGHWAARRMLEAGVGMLRTMPAPDPEALARFRQSARALGFAWPEPMSYPDFIRSLDITHPCVTPLVWQARPVMRGADYVSFQGDPPEDPLHNALAMPYAHATAPLRRLGDRYVLDLLVTLAAGGRPTPDEVDALMRLPGVMNDADARAAKLERRAVDVAEAWMLRDRIGQSFAATVLGVRGGDVEVQIEDPPIRAAAGKGAVRYEPGQRLTVVLDSVSVHDGRVKFCVAT
jgi:VacB/RNase II family 3'-5' exoribonuclease